MDELTETTDAAPVKPKGKGGRPKKAVAAAQQAVAAAGIAPTAEQWAQMMAVLAGNKEADMEVAATIHARAMKKALRPENEIGPMISVYSYPEGDTARPRPKPTHKFLMGPYPIADPSDYNTVTVTEIELLNQLKPGDYIVTKADGTDVKLTVRVEYESNGTKPYKTTLIMPMRDDDQKMNWTPLVPLLLQIITGEAPMQSYTRLNAVIQKQQAHIATLTQQLAASAA